MTSTVDIVNRALQSIGTRTTVASLCETSNEAIQANLVLTQLRDELIRMAPWNCSTAYINLALAKAQPGTPENTSSGTTLWTPAEQPPPPWLYEYQYPVSCLRPLYIIPMFNTGFAGGVPITTAVTGAGINYWIGPPVPYKVATDQFYGVTAATVGTAGTGYVVGDQITLDAGDTDEPMVGAPAVLQVATLTGSGVATVTPVNQIQGEATAQTGSYVATSGNPLTQGSTTGVGTGFIAGALTYTAKGDQRVILTNQESAAISYCRQITDPNVMDPNFQQAWVAILAARLAYALTGDKALSNLKIQESNGYVAMARTIDGNEGLIVNDVTPDWLRIRGVDYETQSPGGSLQPFDWGPLWATF